MWLRACVLSFSIFAWCTLFCMVDVPTANNKDLPMCVRSFTSSNIQSFHFASLLNYSLFHFWNNCRCLGVIFCCGCYCSMDCFIVIRWMCFNNNAPTCVSCDHIHTHTARQDRYFVCSFFRSFENCLEAVQWLNGWAVRSEINCKFENWSMMCISQWLWGWGEGSVSKRKVNIFDS